MTLSVGFTVEQAGDVGDAATGAESLVRAAERRILLRDAGDRDLGGLSGGPPASARKTGSPQPDCCWRARHTVRARVDPLRTRGGREMLEASPRLFARAGGGGRSTRQAYPAPCSADWGSSTSKMRCWVRASCSLPGWVRMAVAVCRSDFSPVRAVLRQRVSNLVVSNGHE